MTVSIRNKHLRIRSRTDSRLVRKARILNHPGPKLEPSPPAFDGTDHSRGICASRTARCLRFEGSRCGATLRRGGRVAREGLSNGRRPSPSSRATATMESSGMSSRSGARRNKNRTLPTSNRRQRQRQQRRVHARPRREEPVPVVAPPEGRYRLLQSNMEGAFHNLPPRFRNGPQEPRPVEERDVSEARGQCVARRLDDNLCGNQNFTVRSSRRPSRHRRDACSMAWRCRFLTARPSTRRTG